MIVGIDLSLNSTGFCLFDEKTKKYQFLANINLCSFSSKKVTPDLAELLVKGHWLHTLANLPDVSLDSHKRPLGQGDEFIEIGHKRLVNVGMLYSEYANTLSRGIGMNGGFGNITAIGIEDYSVAKITNALVIVIETSAYFKQLYLLQSLLNGDHKKLFTIPGPRLKKLAGNGNYNKLQMLMEFVELKDEDIVNTSFHQFCCTNLKNIIHRANVESPVNDMIDAYWAVKYTRDIILGGQKIPDKPRVTLSKK